MRKTSFLVYSVLIFANLFTNNVLAEEDKEESWMDDFTVNAFVDSHVAVTSEKNNMSSDAGHRAYVRRNGFSLNLLGVDLNYNVEYFGATVSLRMGPGRAYFIGSVDGDGTAGPGNTGSTIADNVLEIVNEAYVTWKPSKFVTFDLGQFGTIYGAEVAESWQNLNYTRGALYYLMQPFWHTGLRSSVQVTDKLSLTGLLVNGINTPYDFNKSPSVGLQAGLNLENINLAAGWFGALNPSNGDERGALFDHLLDFVATAEFDKLSLVGNLDVGIFTQGRTTAYYGVSLAAAYAINNFIGVAGRVEMLGDPKGAAGLGVAPDEKLFTYTGTVDIKPVPKHDNLIIRPEFRYEHYLENDGFVNRDGNAVNDWWTLAMGVVVHTN